MSTTFEREGDSIASQRPNQFLKGGETVLNVVLPGGFQGNQRERLYERVIQRRMRQSQPLAALSTASFLWSLSSEFRHASLPPQLIAALRTGSTMETSSNITNETPQDVQEWQPMESPSFRFGSAPSALIGPIPGTFSPYTSTTQPGSSEEGHTAATESSEPKVASPLASSSDTQQTPSLPTSEVGFTQLVLALCDDGSQKSQGDSFKSPISLALSNNNLAHPNPLEREDTTVIQVPPLHPPQDNQLATTTADVESAIHSDAFPAKEIDLPPTTSSHDSNNSTFDQIHAREFEIDHPKAPNGDAFQERSDSVPVDDPVLVTTTSSYDNEHANQMQLDSPRIHEHPSEKQPIEVLPPSDHPPPPSEPIQPTDSQEKTHPQQQNNDGEVVDGDESESSQTSCSSSSSSSRDLSDPKSSSSDNMDVGTPLNDAETPSTSPHDASQVGAPSATVIPLSNVSVPPLPSVEVLQPSSFSLPSEEEPEDVSRDAMEAPTAISPRLVLSLPPIAPGSPTPSGDHVQNLGVSDNSRMMEDEEPVHASTTTKTEPIVPFLSGRSHSDTIGDRPKNRNQKLFSYTPIKSDGTCIPEVHDKSPLKPFELVLPSRSSPSPLPMAVDNENEDDEEYEPSLDVVVPPVRSTRARRSVAASSSTHSGECTLSTLLSSDYLHIGDILEFQGDTAMVMSKGWLETGVESIPLLADWIRSVLVKNGSYSPTEDDGKYEKHWKAIMVTHVDHTNGDLVFRSSHRHGRGTAPHRLDWYFKTWMKKLPRDTIENLSMEPPAAKRRKEAATTTSKHASSSSSSSSSSSPKTTPKSRSRGAKSGGESASASAKSLKPSPTSSSSSSQPRKSTAKYAPTPIPSKLLDEGFDDDDEEEYNEADLEAETDDLWAELGMPPKKKSSSSSSSSSSSTSTSSNTNANTSKTITSPITTTASSRPAAATTAYSSSSSAYVPLSQRFFGTDRHQHQHHHHHHNPDASPSTPSRPTTTSSSSTSTSTSTSSSYPSEYQKSIAASIESKKKTSASYPSTATTPTVPREPMKKTSASSPATATTTTSKPAAKAASTLPKKTSSASAATPPTAAAIAPSASQRTKKTAPIGESKKSAISPAAAAAHGAKKASTTANKAKASSTSSSSLGEPVLPVILSSGLTGISSKSLVSIVEKLRGRIEQQFTPHVSHLVVHVDASGLASRTFKYLEALLRGIYIVSTDWLVQSLSAGKYLPASNFLAKGDSHCLGGPSTAISNRTSSGGGDSVAVPNEIFKNMMVCLFGAFDSPTQLKLAQIEHLLRLGGAKVKHCGGTSSLSPLEAIRGEPRPVIVCDEAIDRDTALTVALQIGSSPVSLPWIIDSISHCQCLDTANYLIIDEETSDELNESQSW